MTEDKRQVSLAKGWHVIGLAETDTVYYYLALSPDNSIYFIRRDDVEGEIDDTPFDDCDHSVFTFKRGYEDCEYDGITDYKDGHIDIHFKHGIEHLEKVTSIPIEVSPIMIKCAKEMRAELVSYLESERREVARMLDELSKSREKFRKVKKLFQEECQSARDEIQHDKNRAKNALALANSRIGFNPGGTYDYNVVSVSFAEHTDKIMFVCDGKELALSGRVFCKVLKTPRITMDVYDQVKHDVIVMNSSSFRDAHITNSSYNGGVQRLCPEAIQVNSKFAIIVIDKPLRQIEVHMVPDGCASIPAGTYWDNTWVLIRDHTRNMALRSAVFIVGAKSADLKTKLSDRIYYSTVHGNPGGPLFDGLHKPLSIPGTAEEDGYMVSCKVQPEDVKKDPCAAFQHLLEEFNIIEPK